MGDLQGNLVAYHSQTVRLYLSNLACLTGVDCHGLPGIGRDYQGHICALTAYSRTHLKTSLEPVRDMQTSVKYELSYIICVILCSWLS